MEQIVDADIELKKILRRNGIFPASYDTSLLDRYLSLLMQWNEKVNLVSRSEQSRAHFTHILHSISPLFLIHIPQGVRVLDLGTGGGLPGIPIGIVRPDLQIVLVDSIRKKAAAVADIVSSLGVTNISVVNGRAEEMKSSGFHVVLSRAVAPLNDLIRWSKPLVVRRKENDEKTQPEAGHRAFKIPFLVAWKGGDLVAEIARAQTQHAHPPLTVIDLLFPGSVEAGFEEKKIVIVEL